MATFAIAGAKGGCGKTTTTIGLAEAVGRTGRTALAVDADRQLPNLHVMGGTNRTPTIADVGPEAATDSRGGGDVVDSHARGANTALETDPSADPVDATKARVERVAQQSPRVDTTGLIAAPLPEDSLSLETALARLDLPSVPTFVDCPSGAGPDLLEPLSAADGVIVVTTDTDRSLAAAETTIDVAGRLGVPVLGVIWSRCSTVPESAASRLPAQSLGAVPECSEPLIDDEACTALESVVERLEQHLFPEPTIDADRLSTGIEGLDCGLGGGVPPGSVLLLEAPLASQIERLLARTTEPRGTLYLAAGRSVQSVARSFEALDRDAELPTIRAIPPASSDTGADGADETDGSVRAADRVGADGGSRAVSAIEHAEALVDRLPDGATLVLEGLNVLERAPAPRYRTFLGRLETRTRETAGMTIISRSVGGPCQPGNGQLRRCAQSMADLVATLGSARSRAVTAPGVGSGHPHPRRQQLLEVSKCRFGRCPSPVDLQRALALDREVSSTAAGIDLE